MNRNAFSLAEMLIVTLFIGIIFAVSIPVLTVKKVSPAYIQSYVPIGAILAFAKASSPEGYLECDGSEVSRVTYSTLFSVIGTSYGNGNGSTTFNIPDLRGEFVRGWSHGKLDVDSGRLFGSNQAEELKSHSHNYVTSSTFGGGIGAGTSWTGTGTAVTDSVGGVETRPRNIALMYIIKAK